MRRAAPAVLATIGGLALLANFHTAAGVKRLAGAVPTTVATPASGSSPPPSGTGAPTTTATTSAAGAERQLDGPPVQTQFGDVQVRAITANGRIIDVQVLQMPFDHRRSEEISQAVTPMLKDEVLTAQSAQIDLISGATYTSDAYQRSLQAALDRRAQ
jgi:uncharacterized protein with FMN-binding domain